MFTAIVLCSFVATIFLTTKHSGHREKLTDMERKCAQMGQYGMKGSGEMDTPSEIE